MKVIIKGASLAGRVIVPASKSEAHRYMICAALADVPTEIEMHGICSDIEATADCLASLGAGVERTQSGYRISPVKDVLNGNTLRCRDSGSTLRFLLPVAAALGAEASFYREGKLHERPLVPLDCEMERHGTSLVGDGRLLHIKGQMSGCEYKIAANISSQFISGILMALPIIGGGTVELEGKIESAGYIDITVAVMKRFGVDVSFDGNKLCVPQGSRYVSPASVTVSGDWSGAAFWVAAGALSKDGIDVCGVDTDSLQGDKRIVGVVNDIGADVKIDGGCVCVKRNKLNGLDVDASDIPDIVPIISVLSSVSKGKTVISGAERLRIKESDRLATTTETLTLMGADVKELSDGLSICGVSELRGAVIESHRDHRIAMSAAISSMMCDGEVTVLGAECVNKSYPAFWDDFVSLGGVVEVKED